METLCFGSNCLHSTKAPAAISMVAGAHRLRARQLVRCDLDCRGTRLHPNVNGTQLIRARLLARVLVHSLSSDSSMRRFFARPSGVSLEATGLSLPKPEVLIR